MKQKELRELIIFSIFFLLVAVLSIVFVVKLFSYYRVKTAKKKVKFNNLEVEVYKKTKVSDFIKKINGKIVDDYEVDTTELGEKEVEFEFVNNDNIKVPYSFTINVVDKTPPKIGDDEVITVYLGEDVNPAKLILCGDNYDDTPKCEVVGEYDKDKVGEYPVEIKATDSSNNTSSHKTKIIVKNGSRNSMGGSSGRFVFPDNVKDFNDVKKNLKMKK